ncbi:GFO-IDH-MocA domain-containing protein [Mycena indigotica]|uniref:GFO-IDH-MocA domain-containing protein n=1 Tax=Mycena indigotica TaxID=2126181 RepID=A0A8H6T5W2_9AGAR|nr:GFO-IDH-MocA domain-containing protein [Mycena indigotica]KAF7309985.1 GFO-IDH-MocA domain-containing protein [Mycena indigotica]
MPGLAILGAGIFAKEAHLPAIHALGGDAPPLLAVYSRSEKTAKDCAQHATSLGITPAPAIYHDGDESSNLDALFARADVTSVIVALPITLQPAIILKALAAGKHVLSEKPVAPDVASGIELIKIYQEKYKHNLVWRVAENYEAESGFRAAGELIKADRIGKVTFFKATVTNHIEVTNQYYKTPWRTVPEYQGGFLLDGGVHTIGALRTVLPHPLTHLSAFASLNFEYLKPHDTIHAVVQSDGNFHGIVELSFGAPTKTNPTIDQYVITGTNGWITLNFKRIDNKSVLRLVLHHVVKDGEGKKVKEEEEVMDLPVKGVQAELASFLEKVAGQETMNIGDPLEALRDVAFIEAGLNSNGVLVDLIKLVTEGK